MKQVYPIVSRDIISKAITNLKIKILTTIKFIEVGFANDHILDYRRLCKQTTHQIVYK